MLHRVLLILLAAPALILASSCTLKPPAPTATPTHTYIPLPTATPRSSATPTATDTPRPTSTPAPPLVTYIVDGDTIDVLIDGQTYRVRYIGIDTPEQGACYYAEAKARNRELVLDQYVRLEKDISETDRYGRLLRYVWIDGFFINADLVRTGHALVYTYPPDVAYADAFLALQQEARDAGRGIWSACFTPEPTATATAAPSDGIVYITNTGTRYHRDGCRYLSESKIAITCSWATAHDYTACSVCRPYCP